MSALSWGVGVGGLIGGTFLTLATGPAGLTCLGILAATTTIGVTGASVIDKKRELQENDRNARIAQASAAAGIAPSHTARAFRL